MALRVVHGAALKEHVGHSKRRFGRPLGRPASAPPRRPVERETLPVSLGVPLGWPQRSGGQAPEADALSTELQARSSNLTRRMWIDLRLWFYALSAQVFMLGRTTYGSVERKNSWPRDRWRSLVRTVPWPRPRSAACVSRPRTGTLGSGSTAGRQRSGPSFWADEAPFGRSSNHH